MIGDTIAAVSTPRGKGGVALLRISGHDAVNVAQKVFVPKNGKKLSEADARKAIYGTILAPDADGVFKPTDDGLATVFYAPASFTGEDTVEICCHGGILLTETVLTALFTAGARPAEAGEFTRRAFLNGKLGLSAAEALGNMLEAQTREQLTLAHTGMSGKIEEKCEEIFAALRKILASIYVRIDYPDEDLADMSREEILDALASCEERLRALADTYRTGHAIAEGIPTVICGKPNVGKSSLYNRLVGHDAAIVTEIEGTTRDVLSETAALGRVTLRLSDTAGLRETENPVERIGIARAQQAMDGAELIFAVFDGSKPADAEDRELCKQLARSLTPTVAILNKLDLGGTPDPIYEQTFSHVIRTSAADGQGMDELTETVERLFTDGALNTGEDAVLTNARQHASALSALEAVRRAISSIREGYPLDLSLNDAEAAMSSLSRLDGREISEEIVSEIFSHFCVGK